MISRKQSMGILGLAAIVVFWFLVAGILEAGFIAVVIVLAIVFLNRGQRGKPVGKDA